MLVRIKTTKNEEFTGTVSGLVNLAYGKTVPLSASNFGFCLHMRISPITFDYIKYMEVFYKRTGRSYYRNYTDLYNLEPMKCRQIFFNLHTLFVDEEYFNAIAVH